MMLFGIVLVILPMCLSRPEDFKLRFLINHHVEFVLYTSPDTKQIVTSSTEIHLKKDRPVIFLIHGWTESMFSPYYKALTDAYFQRGDYGIIHTDWSTLALQEYTVAIRNTVVAGKIIGEFIVRHWKGSSINLSNVHVIGHSLGAHVAGAVGETVYRLSGIKIGRITGLDPAGPLYEGVSAKGKKRLGQNDAKMVDIVHTDDGLFGCASLKGTVNFYPNGGTALQPGCSSRVTLQDVLETIKTILVVPFPKVFCSHRKSLAFYIKSINEENMTAYKCQSWQSYAENQCNDKDGIPFGEDMPSNASGNYYIKIVNVLLRNVLAQCRYK